MAQLEAQITVRKRWFYWPAILTIIALGKIGILKSRERAAQWLVDHAMRIEVR